MKDWPRALEENRNTALVRESKALLWKEGVSWGCSGSPAVGVRRAELSPAWVLRLPEDPRRGVDIWGRSVQPLRAQVPQGRGQGPPAEADALGYMT